MQLYDGRFDGEAGHVPRITSAVPRPPTSDTPRSPGMFRRRHRHRGTTRNPTWHCSCVRLPDRPPFCTRLFNVPENRYRFCLATLGPIDRSAAVRCLPDRRCSEFLHCSGYITTRPGKNAGEAVGLCHTVCANRAPGSLSIIDPIDRRSAPKRESARVSSVDAFRQTPRIYRVAVVSPMKPIGFFLG